MSARYAIYFAPDPTSELWRFGSEVLGYDAASGSDCPHPASGDLDWARITDEPRRYGFHATLKAPFSLAAGRSEAGLIEAAERFASSQPVFHLPRLRLDALGSLLALIPAEPSASLTDLADRCVEAFEPFRAPLDRADLERRKQSPLSERQLHYLERYGYPYVFEDFRFHMTLTGSLELTRREEALQALWALHAPIDRPVPVDALCLFRQDHRQARFRILKRLAFSN